MNSGICVTTTYNREAVRVSDRFAHIVRSLGEILVLERALGFGTAQLGNRLYLMHKKSAF